MSRRSQRLASPADQPAVDDKAPFASVPLVYRVPARDRDRLNRPIEIGFLSTTNILEAHDMCMSCGCGDANVRHHDGDITSDDLARAASDAGIDPETAADNIHTAAKQARDGGVTE